MTVRDRDSLAQERLPIGGVAGVARRRARAALDVAEGMTAPGATPAGPLRRARLRERRAARQPARRPARAAALGLRRRPATTTSRSGATRPSTSSRATPASSTVAEPLGVRREDVPGARRRRVRVRRCPPAIVVCVDAWTSLGGSQFLDSPAIGRYHTYLCDEVVPLRRRAVPHARRARAPRASRASRRRLRRDGDADAAAGPLRRPRDARGRRALRGLLPATDFREALRALRDDYGGSYERVLGGLPLAAGRSAKPGRPRPREHLGHGRLLLGRRRRDGAAAVRPTTGGSSPRSGSAGSPGTRPDGRDVTRTTRRGLRASTSTARRSATRTSSTSAPTTVARVDRARPGARRVRLRPDTTRRQMRMHGVASTRARSSSARSRRRASRFTVSYAESVRSRKPPWSSYDAVTTPSASRAARSGSPSTPRRRAGSRAAPRCPASPSGESASASAGSRRRGTPRRRRAARSRRASRRPPPHSSAARQVRQVAREPEQLELERERERIERRPRRRDCGGVVEQVEEARERRRTRARSAPARRRAAASPRRRSARRRAGSRPRAPRGASGRARRP